MANKRAKKRKRPNLVKNIARKIHLFLGLSSGIIVLVIAITGCIFVFQDELQDLTRPWRKVEVREKPFIAPSKILEVLSQRYPDAKADMVVYQNEERPASVTIDIDAIPHTIYFDPYTAEITHVQNLDDDFFIIVEHLHRFLLLPQEIGKHITGVATIIFVFMLITGLILWWPKNWRIAGQHFTIKWNARWRRKNYDWHRTTGFYMIFPAIVIAATGLSFSYEWMHDALYPIGNVLSDASEEEEVPTFRFKDADSAPEALDLAMAETRKLVPESNMFFVYDPGNGRAIETGAYPESLEFDHQSNYLFHPTTGKLLHSKPYAQKSPGLQLQEMNYGLHTGQYFGLFGKIMAFLGSLIVAALPITGFMIWRGRSKKKAITVQISN